MKAFMSKVIFVIFFTLFAGCEVNNIPEDENYKIVFGSECGWCGGEEFITVTSTSVKYFRNIPCGDDKGTTKKDRKITSAEWDEITSSFDYSLFKTLNYNTCNVCVDGCDEIIEITENDSTHVLRYSVTDDVEGMQELRQILTSVLEEMREEN